MAAAILIAGLLPACEDTQAPLPDLRECLSGMEEIARIPGQPSVKSLLWHDGRLYFDGMLTGTDGGIRQDGIMVVPEAGGTPSLLLAADVWKMWSDGDDLVFAMGDSFYTVPFAGGEAQLVADGATNQDHMGNIDAQSMDESYFYWIRSQGVSAQSPASVWAKPRSGGATLAVGDLPAPADAFSSMTYPTPQGLLIASNPDVGHAWLVDKTTWQWRTLADYSQLVFPAGGMYVDADGAYWRVYLGGTGRDERFGIFQSDIAGNPLKPYWASMPSHFAASAMISDQARGWAVSGLEWFSDGSTHVSYWTVDANQVGRRQACPTAADRNSSMTAAAWSPSYVFLAVFTWPMGASDFYTSIWRFGRTP